ncbi:MAG: tetratricopeptide repeat protein [Magnetococcales bacterium]|nr:tetratricopeptide repeat protein [Magnetococcales bacterium]NGZ25484.1 tetratricopeptide repeat protein [Magnetococcales bacterium]
MPIRLHPSLKAFSLALLLSLPLMVSAQEADDAARLDKALHHYTEAIKENPFSADAYLRRGVTYRNKKDYAAALADYDKAIAIDPVQPAAYNAKAWLLATCADDAVRNPPMAMELAQKTNALSPQPNMDYLDTLAAAHAALGNFPAAMETLKTALALAEKAGQKETVADMQKRMQSYQESKAWRQ